MSDIGDQNRPPILKPMKREVRQRCASGCVICGLPLYTYEHILGWTNVRRLAANEWTLLCDKHQRESTNKLLPVEQIKRANEDPYNLRDGVSAPYTLHYDGPDCIADIGKNLLSFRARGDDTEFIAFAIDDDPLISFRSDRGHWLINLKAYNKNDDLVLQITDNELIYSIDHWDIEFVGHALTIREAQGKILFDLLFEPPSRIKIRRGHIMHNGIQIEIKQDSLYILNNHCMVSGNHGYGKHGLLIGNTAQPDYWGYCMR